MKASLAALLTSVALLPGCLTAKGGQLELAYGKGEYYPEKGQVDFYGPRTRLILEDSTGGELRLGADVLYGKLPNTTSQKTYTVKGPYGFSEDTVVDGITKQTKVKISLPLDYKIPWSFCGNISVYNSEQKRTGYPLKEAEVTYPEACDVELGFILTMGYNIDIIAKETDYYSGTNTVDDIPGVDLGGAVYWQFGHELLLFGRFPLGMGVRVDQHEEVMPFFSLGYRIE